MPSDTGYSKLIDIWIKWSDFSQASFVIQFEEGTRNHVKEAIHQKVKLCGGKILDSKQNPDFFVIQRESPFSKEFKEAFEMIDVECDINENEDKIVIKEEVESPAEPQQIVNTENAPEKEQSAIINTLNYFNALFLLF